MFRPCIDLHDGRVKQIVGGSLREGAAKENFVSEKPSSWFARRFREDGLEGGHVIQLGPGNESAALEALREYPGGLQVGGGIRLENATQYLDAGASHVIVTSAVFREGVIDMGSLETLCKAVGKSRLALDLSCRQRDGEYWIVTDRWTQFTNVPLAPETLENLADYCAEFLVHAVDVEGLSAGIDERVVRLLADYSPIPATYAGGARTIEDLRWVTEVSDGRVDLTIGSALDLFGGSGVAYEDVVKFNRALAKAPSRPFASE